LPYEKAKERNVLKTEVGNELLSTKTGDEFIEDQKTIKLLIMNLKDFLRRL
jgi:hypothetical protein